MNPKVDEILQRIRVLETELEAELESRREALHARFKHQRGHFEREILERQRRFEVGVLAYLRKAEFRNLASAPFIYSMIVPLLLLDIAITLYQFLCFPLYSIDKVRRQDYIAFDRRHLAYLNANEKFNFTYCSYANGLASYAREVVARTEQYWCTIRHARRLLQAHSHYGQFVDYGDPEAYHDELNSLRLALENKNHGR